MKFAVDIMLGTLAKWLRIIGCDTLFHSHWREADLIRLIEDEGRCVLTRNLSLVRKAATESCLFVNSQKLKEQFAQVVRHYNLDVETNLFSICTVCNAQVQPIAKDKVKELVPAYIFEHHDIFLQCPLCGRIYWQGSHMSNVKRWISEALAGNH